MKKAAYLIIYIVALAITAGCSGSGTGKKHTPRPSDTLYTSARAMETARSGDIERALIIIDSALVVGNMNAAETELFRAKIYETAGDMASLDTAQQICAALLSHDLVVNSAENKFNTLEELTRISRLRDDNEQWLRWATELDSLCREQKWHTEALRTEAEIGLVMTRLGQRSEGLEKLTKTINELDSKRHFNELDAAIIAMKRKINVLDEWSRYNEIVPLAQRIIEKLDDYSRNPQDYDDGSYRMPTDEADRTQYIDFYRAQAIGFLARAYALTDTTGTAQTDNIRKARECLKQYEQTAYGQSLNGRMVVSRAWRRLGEYDKMLSTYDEAMLGMGTDTLNEGYASMLRGRAIAASARGKHAESQQYWQRYTSLINELNDRLQASQAHDYAARYHDQEQKIEIQTKEAELTRRNIYLAMLFIGLLVVALFALYSHYQRRKMAEKNRALARMIDEMQMPRPANDDKKDSGKAELFQKIDRYIRDERLYSNQSLQRSDVAEHFGIRRETLNQLLNDYAGGLTFPSYINTIRLSEACNMLRQQPEKTVAAVADDVGLTLRNLQKLFRTQFGMTPTEYRNSKR